MIVAVTKKRFLLIAFLPLTITVTLGVLAMLPPSPGVTKSNFDRIEVGMSRQEVEEIFGAPPTPWAGFLTSSMRIGEKWGKNEREFAVIVFDQWGHMKVVEAEWFDFRESLLQKIRRWFHLP